MFDGPELLELVEIASYLAVNDYEGEMLSKKTGLELRLQTGSIVHFSTSNAALLPVFATRRGRSGSLL